MALATVDAVVLELMTMGQESAAYLADLLRAASPASLPHQELATEILRCCDRVIAALRAGGRKRKAARHEDDAAAALAPPPATMPPPKRCRRAEAPVRVVTSGTMEDGSFIWRKYGQKEINGRRHPRLYHRCANRHLGCTATRRVQRTHEDGEPPAYEIAYYGHHTCRGAAAACQQLPPTVVDFGSNNAWGCGAAEPAASEQQRWLSLDGEMSQGGWSSSSSPASEAGFEAQTAHELHDTAQLVAPSYAPDPVTEFLDGSFDWASVLNDGLFGFGAPHHTIAPIQ